MGKRIAETVALALLGLGVCLRVAHSYGGAYSNARAALHAHSHCGAYRHCFVCCLHACPNSHFHAASYAYSYPYAYAYPHPNAHVHACSHAFHCGAYSYADGTLRRRRR